MLDFGISREPISRLLVSEVLSASRQHKTTDTVTDHGEASEVLSCAHHSIPGSCFLSQMILHNIRYYARFHHTHTYLYKYIYIYATPHIYYIVCVCVLTCKKDVNL